MVFLLSVMPSGMKALGGCGFGIFESVEDLVGFEYLCKLQQDHDRNCFQIFS